MTIFRWIGGFSLSICMERNHLHWISDCNQIWITKGWFVYVEKLNFWGGGAVSVMFPLTSGISTFTSIVFRLYFIKYNVENVQNVFGVYWKSQNSLSFQQFTIEIKKWTKTLRLLFIFNKLCLPGCQFTQ